ncbi:MAG: hypothetical protein HY706_07620 [Candidatus Hydrogenedentes bacterium]|nr:hypothetical protein [Candidatus Hydrogenedentota bacterium]
MAVKYRRERLKDAVVEARDRVPVLRERSRSKRPGVSGLTLLTLVILGLLLTTFSQVSRRWAGSDDQTTLNGYATILEKHARDTEEYPTTYTLILRVAGPDGPVLTVNTDEATWNSARPGNRVEVQYQKAPRTQEWKVIELHLLGPDQTFTSEPNVPG